VGTPTTAGGIEYPGLIVIAEGVYARGGMNVDAVVAHEAGHQWWYSLVGDDQIDEPWIDEALTQFATALYFRDWYGQLGMETLLQNWQNGYEGVKDTPLDKRADLPVSEYDERQYGAIVYEKAPLFFNALYEALDDEKFNQMMQEYFQTYRYKVAYPQDFIAIAAKYAGQAKVDELLKEWITTP
jgi:aminopeptidase N